METHVLIIILDFSIQPSTREFLYVVEHDMKQSRCEEYITGEKWQKIRVVDQMKSTNQPKKKHAHERQNRQSDLGKIVNACATITPGRKTTVRPEREGNQPVRGATLSGPLCVPVMLHESSILVVASVNIPDVHIQTDF